jgi:predicted metal-binding protein
MVHRLLVCTTCASTWANGKKIGTSGGEVLFQEITNLSKNWDDRRLNWEICATACMSACSHACIVTFASPDKHSYIFGDLPSDTERVNITAAAILECAEIYSDRPDGLMAWKERPEPLRNGVIARIPPL